MQYIKDESLTKKHLRVRGENLVLGNVESLTKETPPRTRRKLRSVFFGVIINRNPSAYAEKTSVSGFFIQELKKHLRVRGENSV